MPYIVGILWVIISQESLEKTINITGPLLGNNTPKCQLKNCEKSSSAVHTLQINEAPALTLLQQWFNREGLEIGGPWIQN